MKWLVVLLGLCSFVSSANAAELGLDEVETLGRLNGKALACSQKNNIGRIKAVMISLAPKSRQHGAVFEKATEESFLVRSGEQQACADAPVIALQVETLAERLRALSTAGAKP